ncbi:MAG: GNAT family N-acetyltransferase [Nocardioides sp.]
MAWFDAFLADADEQAGRERGSSPEISEHDLDDMLRRIAGGTLWLWCDPEGTPVHLTAANPPGYGVSRIGPVYTPPEHRGRGYATAGVAQVSQWLLDQGVQPCLFTDQANPTSNAVYEALGYRALVDTVALLVDPITP